jgi:N-methylhydantoinase A
MKEVQYRLGADIGGTFTDLVLLGSDGSVATEKVASTPDDYSRAIIDGIERLFREANRDIGALQAIVHGTTVATNAILEGKGATTALITTAGFRDVLELARLRYSRLFDFSFEKVPPLVRRQLRFEVDERIGPGGEVRKPLDEQSVEAAVERIRKADVQALAVCLLHSYANSEHERRVVEIARTVLPSVFITCSADVLPEMREYERTSTTVINAYLGPMVADYLGSLTGKLKDIGISAPLQVMQSNGGIMDAQAVRKKPASIVESGPAAGVVGAARSAAACGYRNIISLDMGGTTAKVSIVENGAVQKTSEYTVGAGINLSSKLATGGGHALKLPVIDVSEIGAGGGSLISVDSHGHFRVGPQSAGAAPGPVCYDAGGVQATLTDTLVVLGLINPEYLVGGEMTLHVEKARQALLEQVAKPLNKDLLEAAHGVQVVAGATMARAVKAVSSYRGRDPRDFALFAFGGSGPVLAAEVASQLRIQRIIVPPSPGLFSAFGMLLSNIEHEFVQTLFRRGAAVSSTEIDAAYEALEAQARSALTADGYQAGQMNISRQADLRYSGQAYELTVPVASGSSGESAITAMVAAFGEEHQRTYGHRAEDEPVDLVSLRVIGWAQPPGPRSIDPAAVTAAHDQGLRDCSQTRMAFFGTEHGLTKTPVCARAALTQQSISGAIIIEEYDSTIVIPPDWTVRLDAWSNIVMDKKDTGE